MSFTLHKTLAMKNVLTAIIIGMFALTSHLTAGELSFATSNDLDNTPQIEIRLDRIEYISNQALVGTFRLKLHAGSQEIYNEIIDFSAGSRVVSEQIPNSRIGNLDMSDAELTITLEAVDGGGSDHRFIGRLDVSQAFDVTLHVQQSDRNSGLIVQGSIHVD